MGNNSDWKSKSTQNLSLQKFITDTIKRKWKASSQSRNTITE